MAARYRVDEWVLEIWNGKGWTVEGPYDEKDIDAKYEQHIAVMPNCPVRMVGRVFDRIHEGKSG